MSGGVPYHVTYPMMHVMLRYLTPPHEQTHAYENVTFPQHPLRAVITMYEHPVDLCLFIVSN